MTYFFSEKRPVKLPHDHTYSPFSVMNIGVLLYLSFMYITIFSIPWGYTYSQSTALCKHQREDRVGTSVTIRNFLSRRVKVVIG